MRDSSWRRSRILGAAVFRMILQAASVDSRTHESHSLPTFLSLLAREDVLFDDDDNNNKYDNGDCS
jgi:hypothetical protein